MVPSRRSRRHLGQVIHAVLEPLERRQLLAGGVDQLVNNNAGASGSGNFTQSGTAVLAFGENVIVAFNDSGSNAGSSNHFTGYATSSDSGLTFTDRGTLPNSTLGDAGYPVLARDTTTGRCYLATLAFSGAGTVQVFRSDTNGTSWLAPVVGTPGSSDENKPWLTVDNFAGTGRGNVYLASRRFGTNPGIYLYRSTDGGASFSSGVFLSSTGQGVSVAVGPDHSVYAFWNNADGTIRMRRSTDLGVSFGAPVTAASGLVGGINGDLALTGRPQGEATFTSFRSNGYPQAAVNPVTGQVYVVFASDPNTIGIGDKADVFFVQSTNNGATWSPRVRVNDDPTITDQWQPTIAVSPEGTRVGFFYYSRQGDVAENNLYRFYGRVGTVSGGTVTLAPSEPISDVDSLPEFGRDSVVNPLFVGDYDVAATSNGFFHVAWSDNRSDLPGGETRKDPNVYFDKVAFGFVVSGSTPAVGGVATTVPTAYTVMFTDPVLASSVQASDFSVTVSPGTSPAVAQSFTIDSPTQVTFRYASPPFSNQGLHTMSIAAGAVLRAGDNAPLAETFTAAFRYDIVPLTVVSTVPAIPTGALTLPGPFTLDLVFNEPFDPATLQASDLALSGMAGAIVTAATIPAGSPNIARFTIGGVTTEGTLNVTLERGALADAVGNPNPSVFTGTFFPDIATEAFPAPLVAELPAGSMIYDPVRSGLVSFAGDIDAFTLNIDPRQQITIEVRADVPGLRPTVELRDPSGTLIGVAQASSAGGIAVLQSVATTTGGTYTIRISGGATTGAYTARVLLNAALEAENRTAPLASNDSPATAQNLDGAFLAVPTSITSGLRAAVQGVGGRGFTASAVAPTFEDISATGTVLPTLTNQDDATVQVNLSFPFPFYAASHSSVFVSTNGLITFGSGNNEFSNTDLTTIPAQAAIAVFWDDLHTTGGGAASNVFVRESGSGADRRLTVQWNQVRFLNAAVGNTITFQAQLFADGRIAFNYLDLVGASASNNGASATVGVKNAGTQGPDRTLLAFNNGPNSFVNTGLSTLLTPFADSDVYAFTLAAGQRVSLNVTNQSAGQGNALDLLGPGGNVLASGTTLPTNVTLAISNFVAPSAGTYYARVSGDSVVAYNLLVTRDAVFDLEPNNDLPMTLSQPMGLARGAFGAIATTSDNDFYSFTVAAAGMQVRIESATPGDGAGEFINLLNPRLAVYNPSGGFLAFGTNLPDGRNESISFTAPVAGEWRVQVFSDGNTTVGEYYLTVAVGTIAPFVISSGFEFETQQRVSFRFDQNVSGSFAANDVAVQRLGPGGGSVTTSAAAFELVNNIGSVGFASTLPDGNYRATVVAAGVTNASGTPMAADVSLDFFVLAGDANRDRSVNIGDFSILAANFNQPGTFGQGDFNYSGTVEIGDFAILASKFNTSLPDPGARAGATPGRPAATSNKPWVFGDRPVTDVLPSPIEPL